MFAASKTASVSGGYQISRSLRFNSADSAYLSRTPATPSNRKTWTYSAWIKLSSDGFNNMFTSNIFSSSSDSLSLRFYLRVFSFQLFNSNSGTLSVSTNAVLRDYSAYYHVVCSVDTTQATDTNRVKLYINGVQQTVTGAYPAQNYDTPVNSSNWASGVGAWNDGTFGINGYMTEVNFIDGQALTPSSFGETNAQTGVWQPKAYSGSYGTNGFYLNFSDNSNTTAATLGKDYSGNGNNWTPNNFSVTAGAGNDSLVDSPTSYGTDTGVGGTVRGNYCTLNPLAKSASGVTLTNGNLDATYSATSGIAYATMGVSSGKWYWEVVGTSNPPYMIGISKDVSPITDWQSTNGFGYFSQNGQKYTNSAGSAYGATYTTNDVIGVALDMDAGTLTFYKNGTSQGTAFSSLSGTYFPSLQNPGANSITHTFNFGQRPFAYTAPSGFKALCTQNLPTPTIGATTATQAGKFFNTVTYTGTQTTQSVTGVGFQPDFVWNKDRSAAWTHVLTDSVRGAGKSLFSQSTEIEVTNDGNGNISAFNSDGFTLAGGLRVNASGDAIVAWNWKANGSGSTNTSGSITSTVSANTTSGFSVVTYTGTGSAATIGHGLGVAPSMIIVKARNTAGLSWLTYHQSIGATQFLLLNTTDGVSTNSAAWNNTAPTSTVFTAGTGSSVNGSGTTYVAYCFAPVAGYSAFGSYTGNGSADGPFVYTGFRPAYVMFKRTDVSGENWQIRDAVRDTYNVVNKNLRANLSDAETTFDTMDMVSNGFKLRSNDSGINGSGGTYIYMAFASAPLKFSLAR